MKNLVIPYIKFKENEISLFTPTEMESFFTFKNDNSKYFVECFNEEDRHIVEEFLTTNELYNFRTIIINNNIQSDKYYYTYIHSSYEYDGFDSKNNLYLDKLLNGNEHLIRFRTIGETHRLLIDYPHTELICCGVNYGLDGFIRVIENIKKYYKENITIILESHVIEEYKTILKNKDKFPSGVRYEIYSCKNSPFASIPSKNCRLVTSDANIKLCTGVGICDYHMLTSNDFIDIEKFLY